MSDEINEWVKITTPGGDRIFFRRTSPASTTYVTHRTEGTMRIFELQSGTIMSMITEDGWRYRFERVSGTTGQFYRLLYFTDPLMRKTTYLYDTNERLTRVTDCAGRYFEFEYDTDPTTNLEYVSAVEAGDGRRVEYQYTNLTNASWTQTVLEGATYGDGAIASYDYTWTSTTASQPTLYEANDPRYKGDAVRIRYEYQTPYYGMIKKEINPDDGSVLVEREDDGTTISVAYADGSGESFAAPTSLNNLITSQTTRTGTTSSNTFTVSRKIASKTSPAGLTVTYVRDSVGRITKETGSDGLVVTRTYDSTGRVLTEKRGTSSLPDRLSTWTRNSNGNVTRLDHPDGSYETWTYNSLRQPLTHRLRNGGSESFTYTAQGYMTKHTDATGAVTTWTHYGPNDPDSIPEGLVHTMTDSRNRVTTYEYTERGLVSQITYGDGSTLVTLYDDYGNKTSELTGAGDFTQWAYGNFRLLLSNTDPLGRLTSYAYGPNGTSCGCASSPAPTLITRYDGTTIARTYLGSKLLMSETIGAGTTEAQSTIRNYDFAGRVDTLIDPNGTVTTFTYDLRNRRLTLTLDTGGLNLTTTRTYNPFGDMITEQLPSAAGTDRTTTLTYDSMGQVDTSTDPLGIVTDMTYDLGGRLLNNTRAQGTALARTTKMTYDLADRPLVTTYPDSSTTSVTYYPDGRIHTRTDERNRTWTYEEALVIWTDSASNNYTSYRHTVTDPLNHTSTTLNAPMAWRSGVVRQVSAVGRVSETVRDAAGQTILTRLAPGTPAATSTSYGYDLLGRRDTTTIDPGGLSETSSLIYDAIGRVISSKDPLNRTTTTTYLMAVGGDTVAAGTRQRTTTMTAGQAIYRRRFLRPAD